MSRFTESTVEKAALTWLQAVGWQIAHGADIAPDAPGAERADYGEVALAQWLREALARVTDFAETASNDWPVVFELEYAGDCRAPLPAAAREPRGRIGSSWRLPDGR